MIYKLGYDFKNAALVSIEGVELLKKMPSLRPKFFAQPRQAIWVTPEATLYFSEHFEGKNGTAPDVTIWSTGVLVFNPKAYSTYQASLARSGEFLPISIAAETYHLLNTLYVIPNSAVNTEKAVEVIESGVHFGLRNVTFDEPFLDSENIQVFKTNTDKFLHSYCTSTFKDTYERHGFKGLSFEATPMF